MSMLSDRQYSILQFIHHHITDHGFVPSIREIGRAVNISSTSVVNYNLDRLTDQGYLSRTPGKARAFALTGHARKLFEDHDMTNMHELHEEIRLLRCENEQLRRNHRSRMMILQRKYECLLQESDEKRDNSVHYLQQRST